MARKPTRGPHNRKPLAERLWRRVDRSGGPDACWFWQGATCGKNYGTIGRGGKGDGMVMTHRAAWEVTHGPIPEGMLVCHHCDTPLCCNPAHLFLGTHSDNFRDMFSKGRGRSGLTVSQVEEIQRLYAAGGISQESLGKQFGIHQTVISRVVRGEYHNPHPD